jgi:hypothetical protein
MGHEILCWALKFGTPIYDLNDTWQSLQSSWSNRLPLPSAAEAKQRAELALNRADEMLAVEDESAADDLILAALTQFVRERLINYGVFPASRPELPSQLLEIDELDPLANLLQDAMYKEQSPQDLMKRLTSAGFNP